MKKLFVLIFLTVTMLQANSNEVLVMGFSKQVSTPQTLEHYGTNNQNLGFGYRYTVTGDTWDQHIAISTFLDSHRHLVLSSMVGGQYEVVNYKDFSIKAGIEAGFTQRKLLYTLPGGSTFKYKVVPTIIPLIITSYKQFGVNLSYTPGFNYSDQKVNPLMSVYFSIKF